jgi:hypothetical protein
MIVQGIQPMEECLIGSKVRGGTAGYVYAAAIVSLEGVQKNHPNIHFVGKAAKGGMGLLAWSDFRKGEEAMNAFTERADRINAIKGMRAYVERGIYTSKDVTESAPFARLFVDGEPLKAIAVTFAADENLFVSDAMFNELVQTVVGHYEDQDMSRSCRAASPCSKFTLLHGPRTGSLYER